VRPRGGGGVIMGIQRFSYEEPAGDLSPAGVRNDPFASFRAEFSPSSLLE